MCGIAGLITTRPLGSGELQAVGRQMQLSVAHRGPDGHGVWDDPDAGVVLAHRRLAILDQTETGAQPMRSHSGRYVITFNGEIYNHADLRQRITSLRPETSWRGRSDTEVLLEAIECFGWQRTVDLLDGMFAFALWDSVERELILARDFFGEKPLYYGMDGSTVLFCSELRGIRTVAPQRFSTIDAHAVSDLLQFQCIRPPKSIIDGVLQLPPASVLVITREALASGCLPAPITYWSAVNTAVSGQDRIFPGTFSEAKDELGRLLEGSVARRLVADVPVGIMLSGGIDSTVMAAIAKAASDNPVSTFTVGFGHRDFDESERATRVAGELGTIHRTVNLDDSSLLDLVGEMPFIYDEPFADDSQIVTVALCREMKTHVGVAISGDGGDEVFGGYVRYTAGPRLYAGLSTIPLALRRFGAGWLRSIGHGHVVRGASRLLANEGEQLHRVQKSLGLLDAASRQDFYSRLLSAWPHDSQFVEFARPPSSLRGEDTSLSFRQRMMVSDAGSYLPDDVLVKVDRASMSAGLEVRSPYLDRAVFAFAWSLPEHFLFSGGLGKKVLRSIADPFSPVAGASTKKKGFAPPTAQWLRGPLRDWADDLIGDRNANFEGVVHPDVVRAMWDEHRSGRSDESPRLWPALMLLAWRRAWQI